MFISSLCFGQINSVIIDSESLEKVPYVNIWVENENIGTTSNQQGEFELNLKEPHVIVFSAIGYETRRIQSNSIINIVELKASITALDEVILSANKQDLELTIGNFKKSKINHYFACGTTPWITARYFPYQKNYKKTRFLDRIKILTNSDIRDAKFNIRLYSVNEDGEPDKYIYDKNIIGIARKGKKLTEIDLSGLNIEFPDKGFFIAIEWLIIDDNLYEYNYTKQDSNKKLKRISYEPSFGTIPSVTDENSWIYTQGKWRRVWKKNSGAWDKSENKYSLLAIELTLTN
ncbi:CarboxypepD_reg-like domain-containing protein [Psychroflexus sediminis]|uniref:CarboxypepD_reg-like domain-containing protein n=1 Tax=Psychroflexus sediminis TaxID=470826 RepID=A0A1G7ZKT6_9FLAO|nr:CarboxypepD_reg-like domain-containing protein [Psychroflexus sediminis]